MFNIPKDADFDDDFDDAALEDELQAIISGNHPPTRTPANVKQPTNVKQERPQAASQNAQSRPNQPAMPPAYDLNAMMGNLNLEMNQEDDEDFDEDDPELNAQLAAFLGDDDLPSYSPAKQPAPATNRTPTVPSVPSVQSVPSAPPVAKPSRPAPTPQGTCIQLQNSHFRPEQQQPEPPEQKAADPKSQIEQLLRLKDEYKTLALNAKRADDIETAKTYLKKMREVETALESMNGGQPSPASSSSAPPPPVRSSTPANSSATGSSAASSAVSPPTSSKPEELKQPGSLLEELEQRRQKIDSVMQKEQAANNVPMVKMMTRVIKQYDSAIKACKAGRKFDYESLAPAPGFPELPLDKYANKPAQSTAQSTAQPTAQPTPQNVPSNAGAAAPQTEQTSKPISAPSKPSVQPNQGQSKIRQLEQQRDEYKRLALEAKRQNDIENAKQYLLKMKETNALIESMQTASQSEPARQQTEPPRAQASAKSILGELEQRKAKFESVLEREQGNASRVRVIGRVLKQYETAIVACKSGKQFDYESLPIPPGFEQLPAVENEPTKPPAKPAEPNAAQPQTQGSQAGKPPFKRAMSMNNRQQLDYLLQRQKLFKEAAVESNKKGDTTQALDYLRKAKGFQPLITAVENGLPIDVSNIPIPPQLDADDFVMVTSESSGTLSGVELEREEHYRKLELELQKQIDLCTKNKDHFYKIGDVSTASKFEQYLADMKKDYELLCSYRKRGEDVPKYRYERKAFSIVVCNADVSINECVVEVVRAIDLPCKSPIDSYVRFEFPFPKDTPQPAKTHSFKNSLYPEFNQTFKFNIDRKSRSLARIFNKTMKFEIWSKGGLFRSDELIGHISVDLRVLLNKCTIFDSFPILSGRKEIGGKICVKIKLREPLLAKQVEEINQKWIIID